MFMSIVVKESDERMESMSLEQITLITVGTMLWMGKDVKPFTAKQSNGLITLEKALPLLKTKIFEFPITLHLKNNLMNIVQRIGYELYLFLNKSILKDSLEISNIEWTLEGTIDEIKTLHVCLEETNYSVSHFKSACTLFDELSARRIWSQFTENEREICRKNFHSVLFPSYWIYEMENRLIHFPQDYGHLIIGFDRNNSLNINMVWHSVATNNKNAAYYFYNRLTENELSRDKGFECDLLVYVIESSRSEGFRFILSFLEKPIVSDKIQRLIVNTTDCQYLKKFMEFVLRQVNVFGDLHFNIFCYLLFHASRKCAQTVEENLDLYALILLSKGKLEKFDFLLDFDPRNILFRRIYHRLNQKLDLAVFAAIHLNKFTELLRSFLNWLAITDEDRNYFNEFVEAIVNGTQYEIPN